MTAGAVGRRTARRSASRAATAAVAAGLAGLAGLAGCGGGDQAGPPPAPPVTDGGVDVPFLDRERTTTTLFVPAGGVPGGGLAGLVGAIQTDEGVALDLAADVLFDFGRADLRPEAGPQLDRVARAAATTDVPIRLVGHTDSVGDEAANLELSRRRAQAVADALVQRDPALRPRLQVEGRGEAEPVAPNAKPDGSDDPEGRRRNRRVTILFVGARL